MKRSVAGIARRAKAADKKYRATDSFQNFAAQLGIGTDNLTSGSTYGFNPVSRIRPLLEWIHRGSWLGGVAVDLVGDDMTRAGIDIRGEMEPEDIEHLERAAVTWNIWPSVNDTVRWSRLYGGSLAVMMVDGQDPKTPLRLETIGKNQFKGLMVLDRWMVEPSLNDLVTDLGPELGLPKFYNITADAPALPRMRVHHSRCLRLEGIRLPYWQRVMENLWGISVYERLYDRMVAFDSASTGAAQLVYKCYIRTYKVDGLREVIAAGGPALGGLVKYVDMMRRFQSIEGVTLLDAKDDFVVQQHGAFTGLSEALLQFAQQLAGALQIPLVRLFGMSPAGLNSTGESDLRTYYDGINQQQNKCLKVPLVRIFQALAQSEGLPWPEGTDITFKPLYILNDAEKSTIATQDATAVQNVFNSGIIKRSTALEELKQSSKVTGRFTNISQDEIDEAEEELPPSLQEGIQEAQEGGPASATELLLGAGKPEEGAGPTHDALGVFEERKHPRARAGEKRNKSKGGQFVGGSGTTGGGKGAGKEQQESQRESPKLAALRKRLEAL